MMITTCNMFFIIIESTSVLGYKETFMKLSSKMNNYGIRIRQALVSRMGSRTGPILIIGYGRGMCMEFGKWWFMVRIECQFKMKKLINKYVHPYVSY